MRGFHWLKRRRLDEHDFQEEIRAHLAIATEERIADGAERDAARNASIKDFGNITLTTEAARSVWRPWWLDALRDGLNDARFAMRVLAKSPAFSLTVIAVLALGIGLNTAVFTLLKSLALSPLAGVEGSARLGVLLNETRAGRRGGLSYPDYQYIRDHDRAFTGLTGSALASVNVGLGSRAQRAVGELVTGNYFQQLRRVAGREFGTRDDRDTQPVAMVNETMARRFWGDPARAIGQRLRHASGGWRTVVGVAADLKYSRINEEARPYVYVPFLQSYRPVMMVHARGPAGISALLERVQARVRELDAEVPILYARSLREQVGSSLTILEMAARMLFALGVAGMALAALGLYGLIAFSVSQSTHEIGVRMALGAQRHSIVRGFLVRGLRLGGCGSILGLAAAVVATRMLGSVLYGVSATDPGSFARALSVVLGAVLIATIVPVWRGARTNPLSALRQP